MDFISSQHHYLIAKQINSSQEFPFLSLDIRDNTCNPPRKVFQILHKHEELEFILVLKNKLHIQTTMSEITINKGEGAFIPKNVLHVLNTFGNCKCHGFLFPDSLLMSPAIKDMYSSIFKYTENPLMDLVLIKQNEQEKPIIDKLKLLREVTYGDFNKEFYHFKLLSAIYDLWFSFISNIDIDSKSVQPFKKAKGDRLKCYMEFIQFNYDKSISIQDIAANAFTSVSECNRTFKSLLNITAYEYLIQYRIKKSLDLIKSQKYTIAEVAYNVGYNSSSQFTKYFTHHMAVTPSEYSKAWKNKI